MWNYDKDIKYLKYRILKEEKQYGKEKRGRRGRHQPVKKKEMANDREQKRRNYCGKTESTREAQWREVSGGRKRELMSSTTRRQSSSRRVTTSTCSLIVTCCVPIWKGSCPASVSRGCRPVANPSVVSMFVYLIFDHLDLLDLILIFHLSTK